jgi:lysine 2,3-aminomutase
VASDVNGGDRTLRTAHDLVVAGLVPARAKAGLEIVTDRYATAITPVVASLIDHTNAADAIARQFVPDVRELDAHPAELADPIGDHAKSPVPGLVHRYHDRVLLKIVGICPVYCRFCFRREMVGPEAGRNMGEDEIAAALAYIGEHPEIWEVILTGGDPFMLSERRVRSITRRLAAISHVKILRWHTRVPVVDPERVSPEFVAALRSAGASVVVGLHINHPRELSPGARAAIARLADAGLPLLSQTVLLKGVNDDADTLEDLMRAFVENRIVPYYLHHGDLAPGTAHFRVPIARGLEIMAELCRRLSGIARPDYVLDLPGAFGKVSLLSSAVSKSAGLYEIRDRQGRIHMYRDILADRGA